MSGPKKQNLQAEQSGYQNLTAQGNQLIGQANTNIGKQQEYQNPLVNFLKGNMTNQASRVSTNAIPIGQIAQGNAQARENILDSTPAGAGQQFALAGLKRDQAAQTSGLLNSTFLSAFPTLANIGNVDASTGLQQLGGGIRGIEGGAQGLGQINNRDAQSKASTLGMIGGLAGAAGKVATGGGLSGIFGGGGGGPDINTPTWNPAGMGSYSYPR